MADTEPLYWNWPTPSPWNFGEIFALLLIILASTLFDHVIQAFHLPTESKGLGSLIAVLVIHTFIHEMGHLLAARWERFHVAGVRVGPN